MNRAHSLSPGTADRVRLMVEEEFGPGYWLGFQGYMAEPSRWGKEWRFGGQLGFGGKVHLNGARLYVGAYPEDLRSTDLRRRVDQLNARLAEVWSS
jgi:hypothetical protein